MNLPSILFAAVLATGQLPRFNIVIEQDTLLVGENGYLIGPPVHVAGPGEFQLSWSSDGAFLAAVSVGIAPKDRLKKAVGEDVPAICRLAVYDVAAGKTIDLPVADGSLLQIGGWIGSTRTLLTTVTRVLPSGPQRNEPEIQSSVALWKPGDTRVASVCAGSDELSLEVSTKQPYAHVYLDNGHSEHGLIGPNGQLTRVKAPGGVELDSDGYFCLVQRIGKEPNGRPIFGWSRLMPDGTIKKLAQQPKIDRRPREVYWEGDVAIQIPREDPNGLQTILSGTEAKHGPVKSKVRSAWLWSPDKGQIKATLIAAEADTVLLSPKKNAVAYVSKENLMVREIQPLSAKDLDKMLAEAEKKEIMSRAKQVGIAMMIYATDYDDLMPPNADWQRLLEPYMKSKTMSDGFYYEMNGDNLTNVDDPAKKRMGYIDGRYGRAIVYADSHVIWDPKRKP